MNTKKEKLNMHRSRKMHFFPQLSLKALDLGYFRLGYAHGLGNLLFPWARYIVACSQYHHVIRLAPTWTQLAVGPFLRKEKDKRSYFGLFRKMPEEIAGIKKMYLLSKLKHIDESQKDEIMNDVDDKVVVFKGSKNGFLDFLPYHQLIFRSLESITKDEHTSGLHFDFAKSISVHIRRGDFRGANWLTDLQWYVDTIKMLRKEIGDEYVVYVFSDGTNEELQEVLSLSNVKRISFGSSIADLLALSQAEILLASQRSTFSAWAAFLGRMPIIWPNRTLGGIQIYYDQPELEIVRKQGESLPDYFLKQLVKNAHLNI